MLAYEQTATGAGDAKKLLPWIAAASVLAKVTRDRLDCANTNKPIWATVLPGTKVTPRRNITKRSLKLGGLPNPPEEASCAVPASPKKNWSHADGMALANR